MQRGRERGTGDYLGLELRAKHLKSAACKVHIRVYNYRAYRVS